jgi:hypothetical protein
MLTAGTNLSVTDRQPAIAAVRTYTQVFGGRADQVRAARCFLEKALTGCPVAADAILCISELAANAVVHSASGRPGGTFTVLADVLENSYVRIAIHDDGGPWKQHSHHDGRPHGLDIVAILGAESGIGGSAATGWISWVRLGWPAAADG